MPDKRQQADSDRKFQDTLNRIDKGQTPQATLSEARRVFATPRPGMFEMGKRQDIPKPKSNLPRGMTQRPQGDLSVARHREIRGAIPRPIKKGSHDVASSFLPFRTPNVTSNPALKFAGMDAGRKGSI